VWLKLWSRQRISTPGALLCSRTPGTLRPVVADSHDSPPGGRACRRYRPCPCGSVTVRVGWCPQWARAVACLARCNSGTSFTVSVLTIWVWCPRNCCAQLVTRHSSLRPPASGGATRHSSLVTPASGRSTRNSPLATRNSSLRPVAGQPVTPVFRGFDALPAVCLSPAPPRRSPVAP
jgi:hypothetical protein